MACKADARYNFARASGTAPNGVPAQQPCLLCRHTPCHARMWARRGEVAPLAGPHAPSASYPCPAASAEHDDLVYGAARPGAAGQRCFDPDDKVTPPEGEWAVGTGLRDSAQRRKPTFNQAVIRCWVWGCRAGAGSGWGTPCTPTSPEPITHPPRAPHPHPSPLPPPPARACHWRRQLTRGRPSCASTASTASCRS